MHFTTHEFNTKDFRRKCLFDLMDELQLECGTVAAILQIAPQTVRLWRSNGKRRTDISMKHLIKLYRYFNIEIPQE